MALFFDCQSNRNMVYYDCIQRSITAMAIKLFKNLFRKNKKGHIGLTAEEAYAPLTAYPAWKEEEKPEVRYIAEEKEPDSDEQRQADAAQTEAEKSDSKPEPKAAAQAPVSVWMYGFVEEREIAKTLIRTGIISAFRSVSEDVSGFECRLVPDARVNVKISTDPENVSAQSGYLFGQYTLKSLKSLGNDFKSFVLHRRIIYSMYKDRLFS